MTESSSSSSLRAGRSVRIEGLLKRADLNGKQGKVVALMSPFIPSVIPLVLFGKLSVECV